MQLKKLHHTYRPLIIQEGNIESYDGLSLSTRYWIPKHAEASSLLIIVHGIGEHIARYQHLAEFLTRQGVVMAGYDMRGHGLSEGPRAYVRRWSDYISDLKVFVENTLKNWQDLPVFYLGHSLGGLILTDFLIKYNPTVTGVILSSPALKVSEDLSPILQKLAPVLSALVPKLKTVPLDVQHISRDSSVVQHYKNDPFIYHDGVRARTGGEVLKATKRLQASISQFHYPVLLMHGTADKLTDPEGSRAFYNAISSEDKSLDLMEGWYHELMNEPGKDQILKRISSWISNRGA